MGSDNGLGIIIKINLYKFAMHVKNTHFEIKDNKVIQSKDYMEVLWIVKE